MQEKQIYVSDTSYNTICLSAFEKEVMSTKLFNRLHHISQNSTAFLTFPSNRTKRFEHSLGTMKLCGDMFYHAVCNSNSKDIEKIFKKLRGSIVTDIIKGLILKDTKNTDRYRPILGDENLSERKLSGFSKFNISSVFYNSCTPQNIPKRMEYLYLVTFQAVRLCALLHDIGHPPFSHITEESMKKVYFQIKNKYNNGKKVTKREKFYYDILNTYYEVDSGKDLHEKMGNKMANHMISDILFSSSDWYKEKKFEEKYFKILTFELVKLIFEEKSDILSSLHRIIDGPLDGDRMDYVNRDIKNSGINNGIVEYDRLIGASKFSCIDNQYVISYNIKTINTIEDFFQKRWYLYKNIIHHHRVIKTDALLQDCIENIMETYLLGEDGKKANDEILLPYDISGLWKAIEIVHSNTSYFDSLIQWDDNWLLTILNKYYFLEYYMKKSTISFKLEELLSNTKNYYSLIKTSFDFQNFVDSFVKYFNLGSISSTEEYIITEKKYPYDYQNRTMHIIFAYLEMYYEFSKDKIIVYINDFISENYQENIIDHMVVFKNVKTGLKTEPFVHNMTTSFEISKVSNIKLNLEIERGNSPYFYIYLNLKEDFKMKKDFKNKFFDKLGEYIADKLNQMLKED